MSRHVPLILSDMRGDSLFIDSVMYEWYTCTNLLFSTNLHQAQPPSPQRPHLHIGRCRCEHKTYLPQNPRHQLKKKQKKLSD